MVPRSPRGHDRQLGSSHADFATSKPMCYKGRPGSYHLGIDPLPCCLDSSWEPAQHGPHTASIPTEEDSMTSPAPSALRTAINGFCMALADSVPGVSGGTVAFIMGFYDRFIASVHDLVFGWHATTQRRAALGFLGRLALGWIIGMALAALVLTSLFEQHIYAVCSVFMGFVVAALPLIAYEERSVLRGRWWGLLFALAGAVLVVVIASLGDAVAFEVHLAALTPFGAIYLCLAGVVAICAMFLPGISGSTILLILGIYIPVMEGVRQLLALNLAVVPGLLAFAVGAVVGAVTIVKGIRICLERYRAQTIYAVLGMMVGSLYAIALGPTTLDGALPAMDLTSFNLIAFVAGAVLVGVLQAVRVRRVQG